MRSLSVKTTLLTIVIIVVCVLTIGIISIISIQETAERISTEYMNELCQEKADEMDYFLDEIRQDIDIASHYIIDDMDTVALVEGGLIGALGTGDSIEKRGEEQQAAIDAYLHDQVKRSRSLFHSIAYNSGNALTYFYRINPEFSETEKGFLYVRQGYTDFQETVPTDVFAFSPDDIPHVGWYYQTLDRGRPSWLSPYEDANLGSMVTTYIAPLYKAGTFFGIVGMDVSYSRLVEKVEDLNIYRTGYAFLTDEFGKIVYHPSISIGTLLSEVNQELENKKSYMNESKNSSELITYKYDGVEKKAAWRTLSNGLRLFVAAPVSEIEESWQALIIRIIITAVILLVVFGILMAIVMSRVTNPLKKLTVASQQIEEGNYEVELDYEGKDEVGTLTRSFRHLTEHLKVYVSDLNSKAYKDAMTNVKNKAALNIYSGQLDALAPEERLYGVILFDCNNLKAINDEYGHEKGDIYLKNACDLICRSFSRSPVFRIGGDEFVVILQRDAYEMRKEQMLAFKESAEKKNAEAQNEWEKVSAAMGLAVYEPETDTEFSDVLRRADEEMYENKKLMKNGRASSR